ncbi:MAG: hypothetical protein K6A72_07845 [Lachnospiraceae bacterium]|nr:hypothetical protein [Lachnospiraceae bacterium]
MSKTISSDLIGGFLEAGTLKPGKGEDAAEKKIEELNTDELRDYVRQLFAAYEGISEQITKEKEKYISSGKGRAELEPLYAAAIATMHHIAIIFHPLSTYGISLLQRARDLRMDFEEVCGPFTLSITEENLNYFTSVLSPDTAEDVKVGKLNALGAMRSGEKGVFGAGALAYYLEKDATGKELILRIKWLYVDEDYREREIAGSLLSEVLYLAKKYGAAAVTADISISSEWSEVICFWLDKWHFQFTTGLAPENVFDIPGGLSPKVIEKMPQTGSYEAVKDKDFVNIYTRYLKKNGYDGYLLRNDLPEGYIDKKASCYFGDSVSPKAMILSHVLPSGLRRVEYMDARENERRVVRQKLLYAFFYSVAYINKKNQRVMMEVNEPDMYPFFDKALTNPEGDLIYEGLLLPPDPSEDLTEEDVQDFLNE